MTFEFSIEVCMRFTAKLLLASPSSLSAEDMIKYIIKHHHQVLHSDYTDYIKTFDRFELRTVPVASIKASLNRDALSGNRF